MRVKSAVHPPARRGVAAATAAVATFAMLAGSAAPMVRSEHSGRWSGLWMAGGTTTTTPTTLASVRSIIGAASGTAATLTGKGVGVALIDTGVTPVPGLPAAQVVNGPDLSFESQAPLLRYQDAYGHGTHMAGIIVGNDTATGTKGIAPGAKLTSVKVGTANGAVDVSQVIAAVDWVVAHRNDDPANPIKVLNLSYGSGGRPVSWTDPLQFAVEQAWKAGIVVVAAAGNDGSLDLSNPANDPLVISVGAASTKGTLATSDDNVAAFSNNSLYGRDIDVVAPGESVASLRTPGSNVDVNFPAARVGDTLFKGSGTSQATAVTSAAIALLLQSRPTLTPDLVKAILMDTATYISGPGKEINVARALSASTFRNTQNVTFSSGAGDIQKARGDSAVVSNGQALTGERSIFGPFNSAAWASKSRDRAAWVNGVWMGYRFAGDGWTGTSWASRTWAPATWTSRDWAGATTWADPAWSGRFWSGRFWSGGTWSGRFWSSEDWHGTVWR